MPKSARASTRLRLASAPHGAETANGSMKLPWLEAKFRVKTTRNDYLLPGRSPGRSAGSTHKGRKSLSMHFLGKFECYGAKENAAGDSK